MKPDVQGLNIEVPEAGCVLRQGPSGICISHRGAVGGLGIMKPDEVRRCSRRATRRGGEPRGPGAATGSGRRDVSLAG